MEAIPNVNQWVETLQKAQDGDERDAANQNTPVEGLADRTFYLKTNSALSTAANPSGNSGSFVFTGSIQLGASATIGYQVAKAYSRSCKGVLGRVSTDWNAELGGMHYIQLGASNTAVGYMLDCPVSSLVTTIRVFIDPSSGHAALPATRPRLQVFSMDMNTGATTQIMNESDSAVLPAYESLHEISGAPIGGFGYTLLEGQYLIALVYGEYGADSIPGLRVYPPVVDFLRSKIGEE